MAVAYVLEQNASVVKEGERILIKKGKTLLHTLHIFKLDQLVLFGNVLITPPAISFLLNSGVDTVFMSKNGRYRGRLQGPYSKNITLRQSQFKKMSSTSFCLKTARFIVEGKINNLRTLLMRINRIRPYARLENKILKLRNLKKKISTAEDLDTLRGIEGNGSAIYFEGFSKGILIDDFSFKKRIRRPPTDPVNALLSLGYTFLFNEMMGAVSMIGLDPYLGTLHSVEYGRPSLPLDLMEEWRPVVIDSLVLSLINMKTITLKDFIFENPTKREERLKDENNEIFETDHLPVRLSDAGMRKFITQYERKLAQKVKYHLTGQSLNYRDCIREQVRYFARYLRGEDKKYIPIYVK